ncbi:AraC family ligand binding domain-containing protein [Tardiphaga sp. 803_E3_N1_3]|uniref:AraC family ligand binding domain-containing protein n=1 Tax=Tardiphaga sp. 803_E3_N1_3 TaxID=3240785 RepID=UPI003F213716
MISSGGCISRRSTIRSRPRNRTCLIETTGPGDISRGLFRSWRPSGAFPLVAHRFRRRTGHDYCEASPTTAIFFKTKCLRRYDPDCATVAPERGNHIRLFVSARFERTEFLTASLRSHRYALHSHDTFVIGGINSGCGTLFIRGSQRRASAGDLTLYNPGEVHDGGPGAETGLRYHAPIRALTS